MRNAHIDNVDHIQRPLIAIGTDYPPGFQLPLHSHRRAQLLYGATGVMQVFTRLGNWLVPPQHAVWLPPQMPHAVKMVGVSTRSLYIEPDALPAAASPLCQVVGISPLMRQLLIAAVEMPLEYQRQGRDGALAALLLHELAGLQPLPLHIPLPADRRLSALCQQFLQQPEAQASPQAWADRLYMSLRSFSRLFRSETGMSFSQWRQRARVVLALAQLAAGRSVTQVAMEMGYESSAAFSTMFRRVLGRAPSSYLAEERRDG
ncbi:HTH-type transcriptional repressor of iron proteins A [Serratia ficaria]|uniref:AraC family transcriptional regulator n=1 Tax=Serratia ficaria TaxID=61651 RepID=UPI002183B168|nr:helix-turn-helix transcriptional regulator [Serratia ficaria]CAI2513227.1 HTH-type transcriptional repressor of iron proteins A [Serratia ficaria]